MKFGKVRARDRPCSARVGFVSQSSQCSRSCYVTLHFRSQYYRFNIVKAWRDHYVPYKGFKQRVKRTVERVQLAAAAGNGAPLVLDASDPASIVNADTSGVSALSRPLLNPNGSQLATDTEPNPVERALDAFPIEPGRPHSNSAVDAPALVLQQATATFIRDIRGRFPFLSCLIIHCHSSVESIQPIVTRAITSQP